MMPRKQASSTPEPSQILNAAAKLLRRYVEIGRYRRGPGVGTRLSYLNEIREAIKWVEYAAPRVDDVLEEPSTSGIRLRDHHHRKPGPEHTMRRHTRRDEPKPVRKLKRPTFAEARARLLDHLKAVGWNVKTWGPSGPLKTPHATSPEGTFRLWFRPQAVYYTSGTDHDANASRSLWVDIRDVSPADVVRIAERRA